MAGDNFPTTQVELFEQSRNGVMIGKFWCADLPDGTIFAVPEKFGRDQAQKTYTIVLYEKLGLGIVQ